MDKMTNFEMSPNQYEAKVGLKRQIGLLSAVNFLINVIIGSGVFISPGKVLGEVGSVGMMLVVWVVSGVIALLTCLPFGELSTVVPRSGSIYIYLQTVFRDSDPFFGQLPAFIYLWLTYVITEPCYNAVCAFLLTDYIYMILQMFMSETFLNANQAAIQSTIGALCLVCTGAINCVSVKVYVKTQDLLAYLKLGAIVFIMGCGFYMIVSGKSFDINPSFKGTNWSAKTILHAVLLGLYAYDGGYVITAITDELIAPERNIMLSIIASLGIATVTYMLLNLTFLTTLTTAQMSNAPTVISDFALELFGTSGGFISASIICLCLVTSIMSSMFFSSRIGYMAAREGHMVKILCYLHKTQQTPIPAVVLQVILALLYFFIGGDVMILIDMCNFCAWLFYGVMMVSIFILRKQLPEANRPFRVPSVIPVIVTIICFVLVIFSLSVISLSLFLVFIMCILLITAVYYIFIFKAFRIKNFDLFQKKCESLFSLVPPTEEVF